MPIPAILGNPGTDTIERSCCSLSLRFLRLRGQDFVPSHLPGQEAVYGHAEHMRQKHQLEIGDPADTQLDAGNDVAGNIPARQLTLRRQHGLRPAPAGAQHANLRADNVARFLAGLGHVVWISTPDLTRLSQSDRVVFRTMNVPLRRSLQRPADIVPGILPQFGQ